MINKIYLASRQPVPTQRKLTNLITIIFGRVIYSYIKFTCNFNLQF